MAFVQKAELPPLDISPVHVQLTILPSDGEYVALVISDMGADNLHIHLKPHDVKDLNVMLQDAIQQVAGSFGKGDAYEQALGKLARKGNYAFRQIFSDDSAQKTIRNALNSGTFVQVVSKDFFVPWELLYDGPLDARASIVYYWGMQHIISRLIQDVRRTWAPSVIEARRPKVGLIASDRLPFVEKQEIPALKKLHQDKYIQLTSLRALSPVQRTGELVALNRFLSQKLQLLHFACHAYEREPVGESYLFITKDFSLSMIDFVVENYKLKYSPFVILNACLTGVTNPLHTSSWAEKLWECGARGVLATDFQVPDWFGAAFSEALYHYLVTGMPIGVTLLTTRREFWSKQHNPLGLAYALYSSPSIQLQLK